MKSKFQDTVIVWDTYNSVLDERAPLFEGFLLYGKLFHQENRNGNSSALFSVPFGSNNLEHNNFAGNNDGHPVPLFLPGPASYVSTFIVPST